MQEGRLVATPELMRPMIDENTIGAFASSLTAPLVHFNLV